MDRDFGARVKWDIPLIEGYQHEFLPIKREPTHFSFRDIDNPAVTSALDQFQPDVVKVDGYAYRTNWRVADWTRRRKRSLVISSDSNIQSPRPWWKHLLKSVVVRRFYSFVDGALCIGENNRAYHKMWGVPDERLFPCPLPVDRTRMLEAVPDRAQARAKLRERYQIPRDAFVVNLCAKYAAWKRPMDLIAAAHAAAKNGYPVWALLVGDGPERRAMETFCRDHGVKNVTLTGFVNQTEIPHHYAASDAVALTSVREAYGLVVQEGACFGLPAIVSDLVGCVGPNDTARPDVNALVYPWGDRGLLQKALERLCNDRELYARMSAASERISKTCDTTVSAQRLAEAAWKLLEIGPRLG